MIEHTPYYVGRRLVGQRVAVAITAAERAVAIYDGDTVIKHLPLRGLRGEILVFEHYVEVMEREARADARRHRRLVAA